MRLSHAQCGFDVVHITGGSRRTSSISLVLVIRLLNAQPRRSRANLRPPPRSASVIDRLRKNQNPLANRNNPRSSSPHSGRDQTSGEPRRNFAGGIHGHGSHAPTFGSGMRRRRGAPRFLAPLARRVDRPAGRREGVIKPPLFSDLRGYTAFAETAEPEEVLDFLREYRRALGRWSVSMRARSRCSLQPGMTPVPITSFKPQNRGAVIQPLPATS